MFFDFSGIGCRRKAFYEVAGSIYEELRKVPFNITILIATCAYFGNHVCAFAGSILKSYILPIRPPYLYIFYLIL